MTRYEYSVLATNCELAQWKQQKLFWSFFLHKTNGTFWEGETRLLEIRRRGTKHVKKPCSRDIWLQARLLFRYQAVPACVECRSMARWWSDRTTQEPCYCESVQLSTGSRLPTSCSYVRRSAAGIRNNSLQHTISIHYICFSSLHAGIHLGIVTTGLYSVASLYASVCNVLTFESLALESSFLVRKYICRTSGSNLHIKVIESRSQVYLCTLFAPLTER